MKNTLWIAMLVVALVIDLRGLQDLEGLTNAHAQTGGGYDLTWSTLDSGGGAIASSGYALVGTAGQPDAISALTGGGFTLAGGFWGGAGPASEPPQYRVYLPVVIR